MFWCAEFGTFLSARTKTFSPCSRVPPSFFFFVRTQRMLGGARSQSFSPILLSHRTSHRSHRQSRAQSFSSSLSAVGRREKLWDNGISISNRPRSICFAAQGENYTKSRPGGRWVELWRQPRAASSFSFWSLWIFCFGNGTDLYSLYLYHLQVWKR